MQSCEDVANLALSLHSDLVATRDEWGVPDTEGLNLLLTCFEALRIFMVSVSQAATLHLHVGQAAARASMSCTSSPSERTIIASKRTQDHK